MDIGKQDKFQVEKMVKMEIQCEQELMDTIQNMILYLFLAICYLVLLPSFQKTLSSQNIYNGIQYSQYIITSINNSITFNPIIAKTCKQYHLQKIESQSSYFNRSNAKYFRKYIRKCKKYPIYVQNYCIVFLRTQLLILIHKIILTPFELINQIKMCDLWINKLFIGVINFYLKLLDNGKKYFPLIQGGHQDKIAKQILLTLYEYSLIVKLIIGSHKNSKAFFQDQTNLTIKADGFIDCFIMSDHGIMPFKIFFKNAASINFSKYQAKHTEAIFLVIEFFLDLCERSKGELFQAKFLPQTKIVIDEIINFLKLYGGFRQQNAKQLKMKIQIITRLESFEVKIKPKKTTLLRSQLFSDQKSKDKNIEVEIKQNKSQVPSQQVESLRLRVQKLQQMLGGFGNINSRRHNHDSEEQLQKRTKNLGQQQFLSSLNWALSCGDIQACKKLVQWRQNLLKLGRIVGWETALSVGLKTIKRAEITYEDIINVNVDQIKNGNKYIQKESHFEPRKQLLILNDKIQRQEKQ